MKKILMATALSLVASQASFAAAGDFGVSVNAGYTMKSFDLAEGGKKITDAVTEEQNYIATTSTNNVNDSRRFLATNGYKFAAGTDNATTKGFGGSIGIRYNVSDNAFVYGDVGFGGTKAKLGNQKVRIGENLVYSYTAPTITGSGASASIAALAADAAQRTLANQHAYTNVTEKIKANQMGALLGAGYEFSVNDSVSLEVKGGIGFVRSKVSLTRTASAAVLTDGKTLVKDAPTAANIALANRGTAAVAEVTTANNPSPALPAVTAEQITAAGAAVAGSFVRTTTEEGNGNKTLFNQTKDAKFGDLKFKSSTNFAGEVGVTGYYKVADGVKFGLGYTLGISSTPTLKIKPASNDHASVVALKNAKFDDVNFKSSLTHRVGLTAVFGF